MPTGIGTAMLLSSIIGGGASVVGGALANKSSSQQTSTPTIDPAYKDLQGLILNQTTKRLTTDPNLSGYTASGTQNINHTFDTLKQSQDNNLAARGLASSPIAGNVDATREAARGGSVANFTNSIPLLARDMQGQDLDRASQVLNLGRGFASNATGSSGGGAAGAATNLASYLGYLMGKNKFAAPGGGGLYPVGGDGGAGTPDFTAGYG